MKVNEWHKPRRYKHFDRPVSEAFLESVHSPEFVAAHAFSPLIFYKKEKIQYKPKERKTRSKSRRIMYASHRDACILSFYAKALNRKLEEYYTEHKLSESVVAYRTLGRSNYHFSADVYKFALAHTPAEILAFDVSGFFDNLDHCLLKNRLKRLLNVSELPIDWLRVFRFVTRFHFVEVEELRTYPVFAERMKEPGTAPIASVKELKDKGIKFNPNPTNGVGIPQGTPISAIFSNSYMIDFDVKAAAACAELGALYRRYSDDILIVCKPEHADQLQKQFEQFVSDEKLKLSADKTERTAFDPSAASFSSARSAQYLGFSYYPGGAGLRPSSISRQWRKMKKSLARTRKVAESSIAAGRSTQVYTKKLRRRFSPLCVRNFSSYARRSAAAFGDSEKITGQVRRLERTFEKQIRALKALNMVEPEKD